MYNKNLYFSSITAERRATSMVPLECVFRVFLIPADPEITKISEHNIQET